MVVGLSFFGHRCVVDIGCFVLSVRIFGFAFGVLSTSIIRHSDFFVVLYDGDALQGRGYDVVWAGNLITQLRLYNIVLLFFSCLRFGRR